MSHSSKEVTLGTRKLVFPGRMPEKTNSFLRKKSKYQRILVSQTSPLCLEIRSYGHTNWHKNWIEDIVFIDVIAESGVGQEF